MDKLVHTGTEVAGVRFKPRGGSRRDRKKRQCLAIIARSQPNTGNEHERVRRLEWLKLRLSRVKV